jgi:FMN reductase
VRIVVVVGNPRPQSRTLVVGTAVADALAASLEQPGEVTVVDLADHAGDLLDWRSQEIADLVASVPQHDVLVATSPTYKATYTGLLKAFLDRFPNNGLAGMAAVPVMVGGNPIHALAPEVHLRPLLVELGATVPSRGLFVIEGQLDQLSEVTAAWAATAGPLLGRLLALPRQ